MSTDNSRASVSRNESQPSLPHGKLEEKPIKKRSVTRPPKPKLDDLPCDDPDMCCNCDRLKTEAYFNFMNEFNQRHKAWTSTKVVLEGAKCWCEMTCKRRRHYLRARPEAKKRVSFKNTDEASPKAGRRRLRSPPPVNKRRKRSLNFRR